MMCVHNHFHKALWLPYMCQWLINLYSYLLRLYKTLSMRDVPFSTLHILYYTHYLSDPGCGQNRAVGNPKNISIHSVCVCTHTRRCAHTHTISALIAIGLSGAETIRGRPGQYRESDYAWPCREGGRAGCQRRRETGDEPGLAPTCHRPRPTC